MQNMWMILNLTAGGSIATSTRSPGNHLLLIENQPDDESIKRTRAPRPSWRQALSSPLLPSFFFLGYIGHRVWIILRDWGLPPKFFPRRAIRKLKMAFYRPISIGKLLLLARANTSTFRGSGFFPVAAAFNPELISLKLIQFALWIRYTCSRR